jgi:hypothetical protein
LNNVTSFTYTFAYCNNLTNASLDNIGKALSKINAYNKSFNNLYNTNTSGMFRACNKYINVNTVARSTAAALIANG